MLAVRYVEFTDALLRVEGSSNDGSVSLMTARAEALGIVGALQLRGVLLPARAPFISGAVYLGEELTVPLVVAARVMEIQKHLRRR